MNKRANRGKLLHLLGKGFPLGAHLLDTNSNLEWFPSSANQKLGPTGTNEPHLWNPIALLEVRIIDKLKPVNLEMHIWEGRVNALREWPDPLYAYRSLEKGR